MLRQSSSHMESGCRKRTAKWEAFLDILDESIPWDGWMGHLKPHYFIGKPVASGHYRGTIRHVPQKAGCESVIP